MARPISIDDLDMERLMALWFDDELTKAEVAQGMGVSESWLCNNRHRLGLPDRAIKRPAPMVDPTPEEIAERCAEIRRRRVETRVYVEKADSTPYRTECLSWDGYSFSARTA